MKLSFAVALASALSVTAAAQIDDPWVDIDPETEAGIVLGFQASGGGVLTIQEGEYWQAADKTSVTFWLRGNYRADRSVKFRRSIQKVYLSCQSRTYTTSAYTTYMADGSVLHNEDYRYPRSIAIRPDTVMWDAMKTFCPYAP